MLRQLSGLNISFFLIFVCINLIISCNDLKRNSKNNHDREIKIYNENGRIQTVYFINSIGQFNGPSKEFYSNGEIKHVLNYVNGEMEGEQKIYYENGKLKTLTYFKEGKVDSIQKHFYSDGTIKVENFWLAGKKFGEQKEFTNNGTLKRLYFISSCDTCVSLSIKLDENGEIRNKSGNLISIIYADDELKSGDTMKVIFYAVIPVNYKYEFHIIEKSNSTFNKEPHSLEKINNNNGYFYLKEFKKAGKYQIGAEIKLYNKQFASFVKDSLFIPVLVK